MAKNSFVNRSVYTNNDSVYGIWYPIAIMESVLIEVLSDTEKNSVSSTIGSPFCNQFALFEPFEPFMPFEPSFFYID